MTAFSFESSSLRETAGEPGKVRPFGLQKINRSVRWIRVQPWRYCLVPLAAFAVSGCTGVPVTQQRLVSRPGMIFSSAPELSARGVLAAQIEPGRSAGGAQAAGCTACR